MSQHTPGPATPGPRAHQSPRPSSPQPPRPTPPQAGAAATQAAEARVAEALSELETLDARPPAEHVGLLTAAHDALAAQLSAAES